jgi:hypothetical protein
MSPSFPLKSLWASSQNLKSCRRHKDAGPKMRRKHLVLAAAPAAGELAKEETEPHLQPAGSPEPDKGLMKKLFNTITESITDRKQEHQKKLKKASPVSATPVLPFPPRNKISSPLVLSRCTALRREKL